MPIDDAMDNLETNDETKKAELASSSTPKFIQDARDLSEKHLKEIFQQLIAINNPVLDKNIMSFIEKSALDLFYLKPNKSVLSISNEKLYHIELRFDGELPEYANLLRRIYGPNILKTDLVESVNLNRFSEVFCVEKLLKRSSAFLDPFLLILQMPMQTRYLAALASLESINDFRYESISHISGYALIEKLKSLVPYTSTLLTVAEKYGISEITPLVDSYDQAINNCVEKWNL